MKSFFQIRMLSLALVLPFGVVRPSSAAEAARIDLQAQLWTRPLGADSRLKFRLLGEGKSVATVLRPKSEIETYATKIEAKEVRATITFFVLPATTKVDAYLATQVRLYDARTRGLVAECVNYDGLHGENGLGVGVCSGVIGASQYGLTLSKSER